MYFNFKLDNSSLYNGIEILKEYYPFITGNNGRVIKTEKCGNGLEVYGSSENIIIKYSSKSLFFMGFSYCIQNYYKETFTVIKRTYVERLGIMRDCARNAILNTKGFKDLVVYSALMGYNYIELYIEDLMQIESIPYLGHSRGRYSKDEIKEFDKFSKIFGVELIPCIQTLAHLPQIFRHDTFVPINDIADILLIGEEKTYDFIEKVIAFSAECYTSRKINIGMDEAHMMGKGEYMNKSKFPENRGEIFLKHLNRVLDICRKYGYKVSMWSDMFFKVGLNIHIPQAYIGIEDKCFSEDFIKNMPKDVNLIFWDYYHTDKSFYNDVFKKHFELTDNVSFAGGGWTWCGFAPFNTLAEKTLIPAIKSCKENLCKDFLLTLWGDGGGECSSFMCISTSYRVAEEMYSENTNIIELNERAQTLFGNTYEELKAIENINKTNDDSIIKAAENGKGINPSKYLFYNDPLCGILDSHCYDELSDFFKRNTEELQKYSKKEGRFVYFFESMAKLSYILEIKATLGLDITKAYKNSDKNGLKLIAEERIPECINRIKDFYETYKKQWMLENKNFGFEITDIRMGAIIFRLEKIIERLKLYIEGKIKRIEELEQKRLPVCTFMEEKEDICYNNFLWNITGSIV